jgi:E3 Ubiquitin ligase
MLWWILAGGGLLLILIALGCLIAAFGIDKRLMVMRATRTMTASEVVHLHHSGARGTRCEIAGVIECESPISAPLSGALCVAYAHQTVRHVERGVHSAFEDKRYTRERTEIDPTDDRRVRFYVRDASGRLLVDPAWALIDMPRSDERYDSVTSGVGTRQVENVGAWHTEDALAVGSSVYVLGYLGEVYGEAALTCHTTDRAQPFLISHRSEQALSGSALTRSSLLFAGAGFAGMIGVLLLVIAGMRLI